MSASIEQTNPLLAPEVVFGICRHLPSFLAVRKTCTAWRDAVNQYLLPLTQLQLGPGVELAPADIKTYGNLTRALYLHEGSEREKATHTLEAAMEHNCSHVVSKIVAQYGKMAPTLVKKLMDEHTHNVESCLALLPAGGDPRTLCFRTGRSLVHYAAEQGEEWTRQAIVAGAPVQLHAFSDGSTPLHLAISGSVVRQLVTAGADVQARNWQGQTALHKAAGLDETAGGCATLLMNGAPLDCQDLQGFTPLHSAVMHDNVETARFLIGEGADRDAQDHEGNTPLLARKLLDSPQQPPAEMEALFEGSDLGKPNLDGDTLREYTQMNAERTLPARPAATTFTTTHLPLIHAAISRGERGIALEQLVRNPESLNSRDANGNSPLHMALLRGMSLIIQPLLDRGASLTMANNAGKTPLHMATEIGSLLLVERWSTDPSAEVNGRDALGRTPLHYAVEHEESALELTKLLLEAKADPNLQDSSGRSPLHSVKKGGDIWKILVKKGANPALLDARGHRPGRVEEDQGSGAARS